MIFISFGEKLQMTNQLHHCLQKTQISLGDLYPLLPPHLGCKSYFLAYRQKLLKTQVLKMFFLQSFD